MGTWFGHPSQYSGGVGGNGGTSISSQPLITAGVGLTVSNHSWSNQHQLELNLTEDPNFSRLQKRIEELEKRLCILYPNGQLHEKYESLKEAYEAYLIVERLVNEK